MDGILSWIAGGENDHLRSEQEKLIHRNGLGRTKTSGSWATERGNYDKRGGMNERYLFTLRTRTPADAKRQEN